ncbi:MAG: hypothetical protein AAFQ84_11960, partial [Pseudomonadota bacterium]
SYDIIQTITTNASLRSGLTEYVDNAGNSGNPFYSAAYRHGSGSHNIFSGYVDAGDQVNSTASIYDRPNRSAPHWPTTLPQNMRWQADAHVVCVKNGRSTTGTPDKVLGGITYGFTRQWNAAQSRHEDAQANGPTCVSTPSADFTRILNNDSSVSSYRWTT